MNMDSTVKHIPPHILLSVPLSQWSQYTVACDPFFLFSPYHSKYRTIYGHQFLSILIGKSNLANNVVFDI